MESQDRNSAGRKPRQPAFWTVVLTLMVVAAGAAFAAGATDTPVWPIVVAGGVAGGLVAVWQVRNVQARDAVAADAQPTDAWTMDRLIRKGGHPPQDPRQRETLARLVAHRQERQRRTRRWSYPVAAFIFVSTSALRFLDDSVRAGTVNAAVAAAVMSLIIWSDVRYTRRLTQMRHRLERP